MPPCPDSRHPIVFYDAHCGLCHHVVGFLVRRDARQRLRFAPLTGATAMALLPAGDRARVDSVLVLKDGRVVDRSAAVIAAVSALGGAWRLLRVFLPLPRPLRDGAYNWVARYRMRWFGRREACLVSPALERHSFLP